MTLEDKCRHVSISHRLREINKTKGNGSDVIDGYLGRGCYSCSGDSEMEQQCFFYRTRPRRKQ